MQLKSNFLLKKKSVAFHYSSLYHMCQIVFLQL